jgi:hypothetical protein
MKKIKLLKHDEREVVSAKDLFLATQKKSRLAEVDGVDLNHSFRVWLYDRIISFDMEEGFDFFIYLDIRCASEMVKYESVPDAVRLFFESKEMEGSAV